MQCIYFSALQLTVIFIIPAIPTFECEVMHLGFLHFGSQCRGLCVFGAGTGNWDFSRGFGGAGRRSHESRLLLGPGTFPTSSEHPGAGRWCHRCHPSAAPSLEGNGLIQHWGKLCNFFFFFPSMQKPPKNGSMGFWCVS